MEEARHDADSSSRALRALMREQHQAYSQTLSTPDDEQLSIVHYSLMQSPSGTGKEQQQSTDAALIASEQAAATTTATSSKKVKIEAVPSQDEIPIDAVALADEPGFASKRALRALLRQQMSAFKQVVSPDGEEGVKPKAKKKIVNAIDSSTKRGSNSLVKNMTDEGQPSQSELETSRAVSTNTSKEQATDSAPEKALDSASQAAAKPIQDDGASRDLIQPNDPRNTTPKMAMAMLSTPISGRFTSALSDKKQTKSHQRALRTPSHEGNELSGSGEQGKELAFNISSDNITDEKLELDDVVKVAPNSSDRAARALLREQQLALAQLQSRIDKTPSKASKSASVVPSNSSKVAKTPQHADSQSSDAMQTPISRVRGERELMELYSSSRVLVPTSLEERRLNALRTPQSTGKQTVLPKAFDHEYNEEEFQPPNSGGTTTFEEESAAQSNKPDATVGHSWDTLSTKATTVPKPPKSSTRSTRSLRELTELIDGQFSMFSERRSTPVMAEPSSDALKPSGSAESNKNQSAETLPDEALFMTPKPSGEEDQTGQMLQQRLGKKRSRKAPREGTASLDDQALGTKKKKKKTAKIETPKPEEPPVEIVEKSRDEALDALRHKWIGREYETELLADFLTLSPLDFDCVLISGPACTGKTGMVKDLLLSFDVPLRIFFDFAVHFATVRDALQQIHGQTSTQLGLPSKQSSTQTFADTLSRSSTFRGGAPLAVILDMVDAPGVTPEDVTSVLDHLRFACRIAGVCTRVFLLARSDMALSCLPFNLYLVFGAYNTNKQVLRQMLLSQISFNEADALVADRFVHFVITQFQSKLVALDDWVYAVQRLWVDFLRLFQSIRSTSSNDATALPKSIQALQPLLARLHRSLLFRDCESLATLNANLEKHSDPAQRLTKRLDALAERDIVAAAELPYFSKVLLIAFFLASSNPAEFDAVLFGGKKKRRSLITSKKGDSRTDVAGGEFIGPRAFPLTRARWIFRALLADLKGGATEADVGGIDRYLKSLCSLGLAARVSDAMALSDLRFKCIASRSFCDAVASKLGIDLARYLKDCASTTS